MRHIPNLVTLSRLCVLALIIYLMATRHDAGAMLWVFLLTIYGAASDFLDGYLARRFGWITNLGKILDALVDKIMTQGLFLTAIGFGLLPFWCLFLLLPMAIREFGITALRLWLAHQGKVMAAEAAGKKKTVWQIVSICVLFAIPFLHSVLPAPSGISWLEAWFSLNGLLYFLYAAWLTISSGWSYVCKYRKQLN